MFVPIFLIFARFIMLKNVGAVGVKSLAFPMTRHIASVTVCC